MIHNSSGLSPMISLWPLQKIAENHREFLSGWWCNNHLEKYEFVNGKDYSHMGKQTCSKPNHQPNSFHLHCIFFVEIPMFIIVVTPWPIPMFQTTNQFCSQFPTSKRISGHPEKNHGLQGASLPSSVNQLNRPSCVTTIGL